MPVERLAIARTLARGVAVVATLVAPMLPALPLAPAPTASAAPAAAAPTDPGFSMLVMSDPQFPWWREGDDPACNTDSCRDQKAKETNQNQVSAMNRVMELGSWPSSGLTKGAGSPISAPVGIVANGDLTAFWHPEQAEQFQAQYAQSNLSFQLYPGLGNHDYQNNLNDCEYSPQFGDKNRCAKEAVWWMGRQLNSSIPGIVRRDWPTFVGVKNNSMFTMSLFVAYGPPDRPGQTEGQGLSIDGTANGENTWRGIPFPWGSSDARVTFRAWNGSSWHDFHSESVSGTVPKCWVVSGPLHSETVTEYKCPDQWPDGTSGSLAYSFDVDRRDDGFIYHFVQLHNHPAYTAGMPKTTFPYEVPGLSITQSFDWLERDLAAARDAGRVSVINMHDFDPTPDPKSETFRQEVADLNRFLDVIQDKRVVAIFGAHIHRDYGYMGNTATDASGSGQRDTAPFFRSGSSECSTFLLADFRRRYFNVSAITSRGGGPTLVSNGTVCDVRDVKVKDKDGNQVTWGYSSQGAKAAIGTYYVLGNSQPTVYVSNTQVQIDEGQPWRLYAQAGDPDGDPLTYSWDFGDGTAGTGPSPEHTYADEGSYKGQVTVDDGMGQSASASFTMPVRNATPNLTFTGSVIDPKGYGTISGTITDRGLKDTVTATIDWGDGIKESFTVPGGQTPFRKVHRFVDAPVGDPEGSVYLVSVTVKDDDGATNGRSKSMARKAPTLTVPGAMSIGASLAVTLSGDLSSPDPTDTFTLTVDWGDGKVERASYPAGTASYRLEHVYAAIGPDQYRVVVTAVDDDGGTTVRSTEATRLVSVAPRLTLAIYDFRIKEGETVGVSGTIADGGPGPTTLKIGWEGESEVVTLPAGATTFDVSHRYLNDRPPGYTTFLRYHVPILLTTSDGRTRLTNVTVQVDNVPPTLTVAEPKVEPSNLVTLSGTLSDPGPIDALTLTIEWGDSKEDTLPLAAGTKSFSRSHQYPPITAGQVSAVYHPRLSLTDGSAVVTASQTVSLVSRQPAVTIAVDRAAIDEGDTLTLTGTAVDADTTRGLSLSISWGDGTADTLALAPNAGSYSARHQYLDSPGAPLPGTAIVTVRATNAAGLRANATTTTTIANVAPTALLSAPIAVEPGQPFTLGLTNVNDPSSADRAAGFTYAFDCGDGAGYGGLSATATRTCAVAGAAGSRTARGRVRDKDGGEREYQAALTVVPAGGASRVEVCQNFNYGGLCRLVVGDVPVLGSYGFNDTISSLRIIGPADVSLYEHYNYQGRCQSFRASDVRLDDDPIGNDTISSLRVGTPCPGQVPAAAGPTI